MFLDRASFLISAASCRVTSPEPAKISKTPFAAIALFYHIDKIKPFDKNKAGKITEGKGGRARGAKL